MLVACRLLIDLNQISPDINLHIFRASIIESDQFANLNLQINRFSLASITSHASPSTNPFFLCFFLWEHKNTKNSGWISTKHFLIIMWQHTPSTLLLASIQQIMPFSSRLFTWVIHLMILGF